MTALPEDVRRAWEDRDGPAIFATVDGDGLPNVIYVTCVGTHGDEHLIIADNYFQKTRQNILSGSRGAILFRDKAGKAYQVKGVLEYHTSGEVFDQMKSWNPSKHPGHAATALRVERIYSGAEQIV